MVTQSYILKGIEWSGLLDVVGNPKQNVALQLICEQ